MPSLNIAPWSKTSPLEMALLLQHTTNLIEPFADVLDYPGKDFYHHGVSHCSDETPFLG